MLVPRFQDEGVEVLWGLDITNGKALPLTGSDPYYGPLFAYLVGLTFWLFGPNILWPRLIAATFGALTVPATYWLGRVVFGRRTGLIASLLALSSRSLITVSSHYGWSNSLSPFLATMTVVAFCEGYSRRNSVVFIASGLFAGLTVQSHPITASIVVGLAAWSLMPSGALFAFRPSVIGAAVAACLTAYASVLWATVRGGVSVFSIGASRSYAFMPVASLSDYLERLTRFCQQVWVTAVAGFPPYADTTFANVSVSPTLTGLDRLVAAVLGVAFLIYASAASLIAGGNKRLVATIVLASLILLPVGLRLFFIRYISFLLPLVYVLMAAVLTRFSFRIMQADAAPSSGQRSRYWFRTANLLVLAAVTATPLLTLRSFYDRMSERAGNNSAFFELRRVLRINGACQDMVYVENIGPAAVDRSQIWAYFNEETVRYMLTLDSCPFESASGEQLSRRIEHRGRDAWLVLSDGSLSTFSERFTLKKVLDISVPPQPAPDLHLALYSARPWR
jgi:hypothetical protein